MKKIITLFAFCFLAIANVKAQKIYISEPAIKNCITTEIDYEISEINITKAVFSLPPFSRVFFSGDTLLVDSLSGIYTDFENAYKFNHSVSQVPPINIGLSNKGIKNMQGLQYIERSLETVDLSNNLITNSGYIKLNGIVNAIPYTVFNFKNNKLTGDVGTYLNGDVTYLDSNLFTSANINMWQMHFISARYNQITQAAFSGEINAVDLSYNLINNLSFNAVETGPYTTSLNLSHNNLITFPVIDYYQFGSSFSPFTIDLSNNKIDSLGTNKITGSSSFELDINLSDNKLSQIKSNALLQCVGSYQIPLYININNNNISNAISLYNGVISFSCKNNNLYCLSQLPASLLSLTFDTAKIKCLPNKPSGISGIATPVCNASYNPYNCQLNGTSNLINYVNIPDGTFGAFLLAKYPTCLYKDAMNSYWMDTTCNEVVNEDTLNCSLKSILNFDGMQYFKNLKYLDCSLNAVTSIPTLSNHLEYLNCTSCESITSLPNLPTTLKYLNCRESGLQTLPALPNTLQYLNVYGVPLINLPTLPDSLKFLDCTAFIFNVFKNRFITNLPALPSSLDSLNIFGQKVTSLPTLPNSLDYLECGSDSQLTCLPYLPSSLKLLGIQTTHIVCLPNNVSGLTIISDSTLPICNSINNPNNCPVFGAASNYVNIPDTSFGKFLLAQYPSCLYKDASNLYWMDTTCSGILNAYSIDCNYKGIVSLEGVQYFKNLKWLWCKNNQLSSLPNLPDSLSMLLCNNNQLTSLPMLPGSLTALNCSNNQLTSLPTLPGKMDSLFCSNNINLSCLPKLPESTLANFPFFMLSISNTNVQCLPNIPTTLYQSSSLPPVCNATNNPNNCTVYPPNYVNIPDTSFGKFLLAQYPSCLFKDASNLYWMDTTCSGVVNEDSLNCFNKQIRSIIGVEYFKNLVQLNCGHNMLTGLPSLSKGMKEFDCSVNLLIVLPVLPDSLKRLNCSQNKLTGLPSLPKGIKELNCFNNQIASLPLLPDSLRLLYCTSNLLTYIPVLPDSLYLLDCGGNKIDSLPTLPNSLRILSCGYNSLNHLPALNNSINVLSCSANKLDNLPTLPDSLLYLYCDYNKLTSLPPLPNKLIYVECHYNQLSSLPNLPINLISLTISNNNISCLPKLPSGLQIFGLYNTNIKCLPNSFVGYDPSFHPPICNPTNNINQCKSFPTVAGRVFTDNNSNGIKDANEFYRPFVKELASNGNATFSNLDGAFTFSFDSTGSYSLKTIAPKYFKAVPDSNSFNFGINNIYFTVPDIALQPTAVKDSLAIVVTPLNSRARPGFSFPYHLGYANVGTTNLYTTVSFTYDTSRLLYDSSSVAIISNTNNTIIVSADSLIAGQGKYAQLYFTVKPTAVIGDSLFAVANAVSIATTATSANATIIRGSFDPNDKVATPQLTPTQIANGDWIEYTIRFQNTGNDTAVNVVLADTLSFLLQQGQFNVVATSHLANLTYSYLPGNVVYFEFLNINLPDSATNFNGSQGWVTFKVKPLAGVAVGTYIDNKASIYFDYNKPIVTNLARTLVSTIVPVKLLSYSLRLTQADKKVVENIWATANEINASHFNIQRSIDGVNFKTVGQVKAVGVSNYSFIDNSLSSIEKQKTVFYRLQMVDNDGRFEYSPIREINLQPSISNISLYPNPGKDIVTVECANAKEILITDYFGRIKYKAITNNQLSIINVQGFAKGIYLVQVVLDNGSIKTEKLIVE